MYQYPTRGTSKICTCSLNQSAIIRKLLPSIKIHLYKELYKDLPESTIGEKLIKIRYMHNLEREELAQLLGFHWDTLEGWELHNIMPRPESILKFCNLFNISLDYIHNYYNIYFNSPGEKLKHWKESNNITYRQATELLDITHSCFGKLINGKIKLSYAMYLKLKKIGAL